jgi:hypothetical protein
MADLSRRVFSTLRPPEFAIKDADATTPAGAYAHGRAMTTHLDGIGGIIPNHLHELLDAHPACDEAIKLPDPTPSRQKSNGSASDESQAEADPSISPVPSRNAAFSGASGAASGGGGGRTVPAAAGMHPFQPPLLEICTKSLGNFPKGPSTQPLGHASPLIVRTRDEPTWLASPHLISDA